MIDYIDYYWGRVKCFIGWHDWCEFMGYYEERVKPDSRCWRPDCEAHYER